MIYFTGCPHYGHYTTAKRNIITFCDRPFANIVEHDEGLIRNHNSVVEPDDTVYILGDLSLASNNRRQYLENIIKKLNGELHLILGNHDRLDPFTYIDLGIATVHTYLKVEEFHCIHDPSIANVKFGERWICSHVHRVFHFSNNVYNAGVDVNDYKPVNIQYIRGYFEG